MTPRRTAYRPTLLPPAVADALSGGTFPNMQEQMETRAELCARREGFVL